MSQLQVTGEAKIRDIQGPVVANDGVITALDGAASQYVRGDGTLADFPTSSGGGSSVSYYLNSSVSQGTIMGISFRELSKEPIIGTGTDITISADGYVASYITDVNDPDVLEVPGGNFNCEFYFSVNNNTGNPSTFAELYKYNGTNFTLLGTSVGVPEYINQGTIIAPYYFAIPVPTSALALTDRLAIRIYVNVDGRTVTLHTENSHLCQVVTTLSKGMVSLNNLTDQSQFLTTGTSGTNFSIASSGDTHTFNLPVASATNTGKLSNTDWSTFNNKQNALTNPITGLGASGNVAYFDSASSITSENSFNYDASTNRLGVNTTVPNATIGANAGLDSGYSLLLKNDNANYNGIGFATDSTYGNLISTEKLGTASARNLTLLNQSGFVSLRENGNFGVNTLNPAVSGTGIDVYSSTSTGIRFHTANSGLTVSDGAGINFSAANNLGITNYEAGTIDIVTNGNSGVFIASTGLVGINGATPSVALTVNGAISQTSVTSSLLKTDSSGLLVAAVAGTDYVIPSALSGYVPTSRTLTINGTSYDLSANRSWSVGTTTGSGTTNYLPKFTGSTSIGDSAITDNGTTVTLISRTLTATSGSFITNDNNFLFNVELKNTNAGTQALTGLGLADLSGTRKGQVLWIPSNYVTTSLQNSFLVSSVTNIPLILCADATGAATPNIKFQSGATDKMTLFGSTGNLSIGNSTDSGNKLHITAIAPILAIESSTTGNVFLRMLQAGTIVSSLFYNNATSTLTLSNNNAGIQFNTSGASPALTLASNGAATFISSVQAGAITTTTGGTNFLTIQSTLGGQTVGIKTLSTTKSYFCGQNYSVADNFEIYDITASASRLAITSGGNVGIGTSSPNSKLSVFESTGGTTSTMDFSTTGNAIKGHLGMFANNFYITSNWFYNGSQNADNTGYAQNGIGFDSTGFMSFLTSAAGATSPSERMRITSGGKLLIGKTTSSLSDSIVEASANFYSGGAYGGFFFENRTNSANFYGWYATAGTIYLYNGTANAASINPATGIYTPLSDINKKKDFEESTIGLNAILGLKPTLYRMKTDNESVEKQLGFIAQEVKEFIPQAYIQTKGEKEDFIGLDDRPIIAALVKAIQEQQAQIEELKALTKLQNTQVKQQSVKITKLEELISKRK